MNILSFLSFSLNPQQLYLFSSRVAIGLQQVDGLTPSAYLNALVRANYSNLQKGITETTIKSITVALQEKGILQRVGGKRDGRWQIVEEEDK